MDHLENRRAQAREHRGVWYDARADKFVAEVYSRGDRHFLGHFDTAEAAGAAYAEARASLPSGRDRADTFAHAFEAFLDNARRDASGAPEVDGVLAYAGQDFYFQGVAFRAMRGRKRPFYCWLSTCATCGAPYETLTATSPAGAKGITRNCETHRKGGRRAPREGAAGGAPQAWLDAAREALDRLSLVSDSHDVAAFFAECRAGRPDLPRSFNRFVLEHPQSPVVLRGDRIVAR